MINEQTMRIGAVRLHGSSATPGIRLRLERALGAADLYPPGLPSGAVLIVRRLASQPEAGAGWERAARARLAELARHAARPAQGEPAPNAEAVIFADEAELLACLACDLVQGVAATRWWWRVYVRGIPALPATLPALLAAAPRALPAALLRLHTARRALPVLQSLPSPVALALAERMVATYGGPPLDLDAPERGPALSPSAPRPAALARVDPPWPPVPAGLTHEQQLLLGLALTLGSRPASLRAPAFQRALKAWWAYETRVADAGMVHGVAIQAHATAAQHPSPPAHPPKDNGAPAAEQPAIRDAPPPSATTPLAADAEPPRAAPEPPAAPERADHRNSPGFDPVVEAPATPTIQRSSPLPAVAAHALTGDRPLPLAIDRAGRPTPPPDGSPASAAVQPAASTPEDAPTPEQPASAVPSVWPALGNSIATELGGTLFLLNLLAALDLVEHSAPDGSVGPWGVVALLAWNLLGDPAAYAADPLWELLAHLEGETSPTRQPARLARPNRRGSRRLPGARTYRIPPEWLRQLPPDPAEQFYWAKMGRRLRLWSSRGYILFDGHTSCRSLAVARAMLVKLGCASARLRRWPDVDAVIPTLARGKGGQEGESRKRAEMPQTPSRSQNPAPESGLCWERSPLFLPLQWVVQGERTAKPPALKRHRAERASSPSPTAHPPSYRLSPASYRRLALCLPYIRLRLTLALGAAAAANLAETLLVRRGIIHLSATHVDLVLRLESINLAVRLAGLDRNPGWFPGCGRVVLFHFTAAGDQEVWL